MKFVFSFLMAAALLTFSGCEKQPYSKIKGMKAAHGGHGAHGKKSDHGSNTDSKGHDKDAHGEKKAH